MGGGGRGGRGRARTQRRHFSEKRENVWNRPKSDPSNTNDDSNGHNSDSGPWLPFATQNPAFDEYYKEQGIVSPEEWYTFIEYLRKPLPAAFRINSSSQFWMDIQSQLENDFAKSLQAEFIGGDEAQALRPLAWYPENLAWHSNFSRMQLRKNQALERFHEFLKLENEIGNITRQEAVSMVPPLFLDVHPGHFVLDMCAAPGSKTFQLLEIIHRSIKPGSLPEGLVVANDLDVQRCNLLIHQTKRMCTANLVVTNHEAQQFPSCRLNKSFLNEPEMGKQSGLNQLIFDRILCDVPCSGDGTLRKAPDIWRKWTTGMGNGIHRLQVLIAMRGISLLKVGGRMVYSTCSMNPVENEAVVAEILRKCGGCIELLDVSSELPQLVRRPGLKKWKVRDRGTWLASYNDVPASRRAAITPSMFPSGRKSVDPTGHSVALQLEHQNEHALGSGEQSFQSDVPVTLADDLEKEVSDFPLEFCMRIVPHDQNGGAFFIAVFQKVASLPGAALEKQNACREKSFESDRQTDEAQNMLLEDMYTSEDCAENGSNEIFSKASLEPHVPGAVSEAADCIDVCGGQDSKETEAPGNEDVDGRKAGSKRKLQMQGKWKGVDPVVFFEDEEVINIRTFYGIDESFPLRGHLVTRNSETNRVKRIYYISKSVKELLELNFKVGQQLKITSIGLKMFERQTSREGTSAPCLFRISSEGLPLILPYLTKQIIDVPAVDFKHLLQYKSVRFSDFVDAEFGENVSKLMPGCCVVVLRKDDQDSSKPNLVRESPIAIGCWKGKATLSVMVTAIDCQELLERLLLRMESKKESSAVKRTSSENGNEGINNNELTEDVDDIRLMAK